jgi:hypothetical protein
LRACYSFEVAVNVRRGWMRCLLIKMDVNVERKRALAPGRRSVEDVKMESLSTVVSVRKVSKAGKSHSARLGRTTGSAEA